MIGGFAAVRTKIQDQVQRICGAVSEAFANDITRMLGIPAQELTLVRGQYSDGHPKIMLEAKFADGYKDMERGYIKDGQIVPPDGEQVENLGRYKAFFLVTADRELTAVFSEEKKPSVRAELQRYKRESRRLQEESRRNLERTQGEEPRVPNGMTVHRQPMNKKHDKER